MKNRLVLILQIALALMLLVFGANKFLHFLPQPEAPLLAKGLLMAMGEAGYFFPTVGGVFIFVGLLLLFDRFVALGLLLLTPITVNILLFHLYLDPEGIAMGAVLGALNLTLLLAHKSKYAPLLSSR